MTNSKSLCTICFNDIIKLTNRAKSQKEKLMNDDVDEFLSYIFRFVLFTYKYKKHTISLNKENKFYYLLTYNS